LCGRAGRHVKIRPRNEKKTHTHTHISDIHILCAQYIYNMYGLVKCCIQVFIVRTPMCVGIIVARTYIHHRNFPRYNDYLFSI